VKSLIYKTILISCSAFVAVLIFAISIFNFAAPMRAAKFYESFGMTRMSTACYNKAFRNSEKIHSMSFMFDLAANRNAHGLVVRYGHRMLEHEGFTDFVETTNATYSNLFSSATSQHVKQGLVALYGETNHIINNMVAAKANTKVPSLAKALALEHLRSSEANENIVFAIGTARKAGIRFSAAEVNEIIIKYQTLQASFSSVTNFSQAVIRLRLIEMSYTLSKIAEASLRSQFLLEANGYLAMPALPA
jgi:transcription termination factor NusB